MSMSKLILMIFLLSLPLMAHAESSVDSLKPQPPYRQYFQRENNNSWYLQDAAGNFFKRTIKENDWHQVKATLVYQSSTVTEYELGGSHGLFWGMRPDRVRISVDPRTSSGYLYQMVSDGKPFDTSIRPGNDEPPSPAVWNNKAYQKLVEAALSSEVCNSGKERTLVCNREAVVVCVTQKAFEHLVKDGEKELKQTDCKINPESEPIFGRNLAPSTDEGKADYTPQYCAKHPPCSEAFAIHFGDSSLKGKELSKKISERMRAHEVDETWRTKWQQAGGSKTELPSHSTLAQGAAVGLPDVHSIHIETIRHECNEKNNEFTSQGAEANFPHCWKALECTSRVTKKPTLFWASLEEIEENQHYPQTQGLIDLNCEDEPKVKEGSFEDIKAAISKSDNACISNWQMPVPICPAGDNRPKSKEVVSGDPKQSTPGSDLACYSYYKDYYTGPQGCTNLESCRGTILKSCKTKSGCDLNKCIDQYEKALKSLSGGAALWNTSEIQKIYKQSNVINKANAAMGAIATLLGEPDGNTEKDSKPTINGTYNTCMLKWAYGPSCGGKKTTLLEIQHELLKFIDPDYAIRKGDTKVNLYILGQLEKAIAAASKSREGFNHIPPETLAKNKGTPTDYNFGKLSSAFSELSKPVVGGKSFFDALREASKNGDLPVVSLLGNKNKVVDYKQTLINLNNSMSSSTLGCIQKVNGENSIKTFKALFSRDLDTAKDMQEWMKNGCKSAEPSTSDLKTIPDTNGSTK